MYADLSFTPDMFTGLSMPLPPPHARYVSRQVADEKLINQNRPEYRGKIPSVKALSNHGWFNNHVALISIPLPLFLSLVIARRYFFLLTSFFYPVAVLLQRSHGAIFAAREEWFSMSPRSIVDSVFLRKHRST